MGWQDAPIVSEPAWKRAPEDKPRSAKDEKLARDIGILLGPGDTPEKARIEGEVAGRRAGPGVTTGLALKQGTMRNFMDEVGGASAASGLPELFPVGWSAPIGAARIAFGDKGAYETYQRERERLRGFYEGASQQNPLSSIGGEVAGGFAGVNPAGRVANVAVNAADAALSGSGAGEDAASRGTGAAVGAGVGGTISAAIPAITNRLAHLYRGVRGLMGGEAAERIAEREAGERTANAFRRDLPNVTPEQQAANQFADQTGQSGEKVLADYGGETVRALTRRSTNESADAQRMVKDVVDPRYQSQAQRVGDWWDNLTGQPNAHVRRQNLEARASRENRPRYDAAYNSPAAQAVWSPELETLTTSDAVRTAIRDTNRTSSDYAALAGQRQAPRNPFVDDPQTGTLTLPPGQAPTLPFWDHVQRNLRSQADRARRAGDDEAASRTDQLRRQLNEQLDTTVPEFRAARAGAAAEFGAQDALEAGTLFLKGRGNANEAKGILARMSPAERDQFREGLTDEVRAQVRGLTDGRDVAKMFQSPELRERLILGLGPSRAAELQGALRVERGMNDLKGALSNSTTAQQLIQAGVLGAGVGAGANYLSDGDLLSGSGVSTSALTGALAVGLKSGNNRLNEAVSQRVARLLMSQDPADAQRVMRMVHGNSAIRGAVSEFFDRVAAVTGQQAGTEAAEGTR
jgi:hypothetical protein